MHQNVFSDRVLTPNNFKIITVKWASNIIKKVQYPTYIIPLENMDWTSFWDSVFGRFPVLYVLKMQFSVSFGSSKGCSVRSVPVLEPWTDTSLRENIWSVYLWYFRIGIKVIIPLVVRYGNPGKIISIK